MSTFGGKIEEIPGISVDRFTADNLNSVVFFLSHCHSDHMKGLNSPIFQTLVKKRNNYLYTSAISSVILKAIYPELSNSIRELPLEYSTSIPVQDETISVTCVPAGHCPGSVMFLFETNCTKIVYTGDYRINITDIKRIKCFYDIFDNIKHINKIYLDTTFFLKEYTYFPKREESLLELCKIILNWVSLDLKNIIKLEVCANYGYEYIFKAIYNHCKMPVHVDTQKYHFCCLIPELDKCVCNNSLKTQIHCCSLSCDLCKYTPTQNIRMIKISAFRWKNKDFKDGPIETDDKGIFYVCYSTHASYEESIALIEFLKPKDIHICVERPSEPVEDEKIKMLVKEKLKEINPTDNSFKELKFFNIEDPNQVEPKIGSPPRKVLKTYCDAILDSPPR